MRFIMSIILIGIGAGVFFMFSNPMYKEMKELQSQSASYNEALNNSKALENERDKLTAKDNSINPDDKMKLLKLLPDSVDNIRLILEIEQMALPYGMALRDVKYNTTDSPDKTAAGGEVAAVRGGEAAQDANKDYGSWDLEFSTVGTYNNFLNFIRDIEKNLRIVDISSITFSSAATASARSGSGAAAAASNPELYKYDFKIKTYWLKNK